jgi:hypothetical protein
MVSLLSDHTMLADEIEQVYRQFVNQWSGCDWPTAFGQNGLDLNGLKASQAFLLAWATSGSERADWQAALPWLTTIEQEASEANEQARQAVALAQAGNLHEALSHAQRACVLEAKYHDQLVWQLLREAIEAALVTTARER